MIDNRGRLFAGSSRQVRGVLFVFGTDVLDHIRVRKKLLDEIDRDRPGENFRVCNRHDDIEMAKISPLEALFDTHVLAVPMAAGVQPTEIVESYRVDYQSISVPLADGISQPCRRCIRRKLAAVGVDLAEDGLDFIQHQSFAGRLNDLEWLGQQIRVGHAIG